MFRVLTALDAWDRRLFQRLTGRERRIVDTSLKRLSNSANRSILWFAIAALIALLGGPRGAARARSDPATRQRRRLLPGPPESPLSARCACRSRDRNHDGAGK